MKKTLNLIIKPLLILVLIAFTGCEKDLYEDSIKDSSKNITVSKISLNDLDKKISSKINEKISIVKKLSIEKNKNENRFEYDNSLDLYIDTENGKLVNNEGELSYTFPIFRDDENNLENIIFKLTSNDEIETYVAKYNVTPEEFINLTYEEISNLEPELQKATASGWYIICVASQIQTGVSPIDNGDLTGNFGYEPVWETTGTTCYFIDNSGSSPNYSPVVISNSPSSNGGGGATANVGVSTTPTGISPDQLLIKDFVRDYIEDDQYAWYVKQSQQTQDNIFDYLLIEDFSTESKNFIKEIIDIVKTETIVDSNAFSFVLKAKTQNKINNDLDDTFLLSVDHLMDLDVTNYIVNNPTDPLWIHFSIQCAVLRANHPNWSDLKIYWEASKEMVHITLDILGLVPVVGEVADLTNGVLYLVEGDGVNASLSAASAVPIAGWIAVSTKYAFKIVDASQTATTIVNRVKLTWRVLANGTIYFGSNNTCRAQLRKVLGLAVGNPLIAHHIMPLALQTHEVIQKAAKSGSAFHMNEALNGIGLSAAAHNGSHANYTSIIFNKLEDFKTANPNATPQQCYNFLINLINQIKAWIIANPNTNINSIVLP